MRDIELRRDGNAAAGALAEIFTPEATAATARCAGCGAEGAVGTAHLYDRGPGLVLRCPSCTAVLMRIARIGDRTVADLRGVTTLAFRAGS